MAYFHNHTDVVEQYCTCLAKVNIFNHKIIQLFKKFIHIFLKFKLLKSKYYDLFEKLNQESIIYLMKFGNLRRKKA